MMLFLCLLFFPLMCYIADTLAKVFIISPMNNAVDKMNGVKKEDKK